MIEELEGCDRVARKEHRCNLCGGIIKQGELYRYSKLKLDSLYEWKEHKKCEFIAGEIWEYCEPDEGMTYDDFYEGCCDICREFICPGCEKYENGECDESYCLDKVYELLQKYELYRAFKNQIYEGWKLRERGKKNEDT